MHSIFGLWICLLPSRRGFIRNERCKAEVRVNMGPLQLHNLFSTSRSHLVCTTDQMNRDSSGFCVIAAPRSGSDQAKSDTGNIVPTNHLVVLYTVHTHLPTQLKCDGYTNVMTLCCVISCFMLRCSAIILDDRNKYLSNGGGGKIPAYPFSGSRLSWNCIVHFVPSTCAQHYVHCVCVQCGGSVCGSMREVCVSMCVCVQHVEGGCVWACVCVYVRSVRRSGCAWACVCVCGSM